MGAMSTLIYFKNTHEAENITNQNLGYEWTSSGKLASLS